MGGFDILLAACGFAMREAALFAAFGFLLLGLSDLAVDLIWLSLRVRNRKPAPMPIAARPGRLAVFVPAWDEAAVIGAMLAHSQAAFGAADYRLYVGCYPNDPATIAAVRAAAGPRVRLVIGPAPGPTSKADCLNRLWEAMIEDEAADGVPVKAVILHDAEDVVHSAELPLFDALSEQYDLVQLPVVPLIDPRSRFVSGHYLDEFCEAHGKELVVRAAIGASLPSAGVGCAIARDALAALAAARGAPFDPDSLTEDYELGLRLHMLHRRAAFVRAPAGPGRPIVATREYFPATLDAAVAQKARWMTGIALAGWDRLGWSGGPAECWMRLRDRQSLLAAFVLASAYLALLLFVLLLVVDWLSAWTLPPFTPALTLLLAINSLLLLWRLAMRVGFVASMHGWREGIRALPRTITANIIAMMAARRALARYLSGRTSWDKTAHAFPQQLPAE
ncbi:MAG TPA: glycosyl transferase family protein [Allosphingosinicella sp.]|nr:glycosyl transferase family protein [Allosphingosinicella sp.]